MRLVKLTGMPHPDYGNQSKPLYVNPERITYIERSFSGWYKEHVREEFNQTLQRLHEEVERIVSEIRGLGVSMEIEDNAKLSISLRDQIAALQAAAQLVARASTQPLEHPRVECTTIGLSYADGSGTARVHVMESPEVCAQLIYPTVAGQER